MDSSGDCLWKGGSYMIKCVLNRSPINTHQVHHVKNWPMGKFAFSQPGWSQCKADCSRWPQFSVTCSLLIHVQYMYMYSSTNAYSFTLPFISAHTQDLTSYSLFNKTPTSFAAFSIYANPPNNYKSMKHRTCCVLNLGVRR